MLSGEMFEMETRSGAQAERGGDSCPAVEVVKLVQIFVLVSDTLPRYDRGRRLRRKTARVRPHVSELPSQTRCSWEKNLGSTVLQEQALWETQGQRASRELVSLYRENKQAMARR